MFVSRFRTAKGLRIAKSFLLTMTFHQGVFWIQLTTNSFTITLQKQISPNVQTTCFATAIGELLSRVLLLHELFLIVKLSPVGSPSSQRSVIRWRQWSTHTTALLTVLLVMMVLHTIYQMIIQNCLWCIPDQTRFAPARCHRRLARPRKFLRRPFI